MNVEQTVKRFIEQHSQKSFTFKDKIKIGEQLKLKESTVGWALWNLARKGLIDKYKKGQQTYFRRKQ